MGLEEARVTDVTHTGLPSPPTVATPTEIHVEPTVIRISEPAPAATAASPEAQSRPGSRPGEEVLSLLGHVGISAVPGPGELMDAEALTDPKASGWERGAAGLSLGASFLSYGVLPNFGALRRGLGLHRLEEATESSARTLRRSEPIVERPVARHEPKPSRGGESEEAAYGREMHDACCAPS